MGLGQITMVLLSAGAFCSIVGGMAAGVWNIRWYDNVGDLKRIWMAPNKSVADSALTSGIFGIVVTIVAIAALVLLFIGFNAKIVAILFLVAGVLFIGECVPEVIVLCKTRYGMDSGVINAPHHKCEFYEDEDYKKWVDNYAVEQAKYGGDISLVLQTVFQPVFGYAPALPGFSIAPYYAWEKDALGDFEWKDHEVNAKPCIIDFTKSELKVHNDYSCDVSIEVVECRGAWSASAIENAITRICDQMKEAVEESAQDEKDREEARKDKVDYSKYEAKNDKESYLEGIRLDIAGLFNANELILGVQSVGFFGCLVGAILFFVAGSSQIGSD